MTRGFRWSVVGVGSAFGFLLTVSGLGDYDTIHDGPLVKNPCIFLMMAGVMAIAFTGLVLVGLVGASGARSFRLFHRLVPRDECASKVTLQFT